MNFAQRFTDTAITGLFDQLRNAEHVYRNVKEQEEKEKELSPCCGAEIINYTFCKVCKEHV